MADVTDRWTQVQTLFEDALDRPADERTAWLRAACGDDPDLYREVEALLDGDAHQNALLDGRVSDLLGEAHLGDALVPSRLGERVGPWRIEARIGEGGMGAVYRAERVDGAYEQTAALKLVKPGMDSEAVLARFRSERQILARLQHAGIARLLDGGLTEAERPYFAMEYVDGEPITAYCDARRLGVDARLRLFVRVCEAVRYAHRALVVHRDLKPSNVLVGVGDEGLGVGNGTERASAHPRSPQSRFPNPQSPQVKLLDFGIARVLSDDGEADLTRTGQRVLTPSYAAPEQVRGEAPTTATDVYALGGLLYRLLCGARPIETDGRTPVEIEQAVLAETPRRPSDRVTPEAAVARSAPEAALARRLRGDLDTITLTALEKDPERRYGSAAELLADVERHLGGLPIDARPASRGYRARLFVRRHRLGVAGTAAALAAIGIVAGIAFARVSAERDLAAAEARRSEEVVGFLQTMLRSASPYEEPGEELTARELLDRGAEQIGTDLADEPATQAALQVLIADVYLDLFRSEDAVPLYREALATRRRLGLGIEAANTARQLGRALRDLEQYEEAEPLLRSALAELEALDADPNTIAFTRRHLASLLRDRGDFETSEAMYRQALAMAERQPEPDEELIEDILNSLAIVLRAQDKDPESVVILGQLVDRARSASPERPYSLATSLTMYSRSLSDIGRGEEGIAMAREAAALFREIHADTTHPDVATSIQGIGRALEANGDLEAADRAYTEAVARLRAALGDTDLRPLAIMNAQATLKDRIGRPDEAAELYREVIANTDLYPGRQAITLSLFADSRARQGDVPEAMRAFRRSAAHFRAEGDAEGLDDIITDFAEALREGGQDDLADEVLRERPASE